MVLRLVARKPWRDYSYHSRKKQSLVNVPVVLMPGINSTEHRVSLVCQNAVRVLAVILPGSNVQGEWKDGYHSKVW